MTQARRFAPCRPTKLAHVVFQTNQTGRMRDWYCAKPQELIDAFRRNAVRARSFTGVVLRGARHDFDKRGRELADVIVRWVRDPRAPMSPGG